MTYRKEQLRDIDAKKINYHDNPEKRQSKGDMKGKKNLSRSLKSNLQREWNVNYDTLESNYQENPEVQLVYKYVETTLNSEFKNKITESMIPRKS